MFFSLVFEIWDLELVGSLKSGYNFSSHLNIRQSESFQNCAAIV